MKEVVAMSRPRSGPTVALRLLAADLRARREAAGLTIESSASALGVHPMTLSRLELARTAPRRATVSHLLRLYGTPEPEMEKVLTSLEEARRPGWWHPYRDIIPDYFAALIDLESAARLIRTYAPGVVPELLQTPRYARVLLELRYPRAAAEEIDRRLGLLKERQQQTVAHGRGPVQLWALIEEAVLDRVIGDRGVMAEQLAHLDSFTRQRGAVTVQVVPSGAGQHPLLLSGSADIMRYAHHKFRDRLIVRGLHPETVTVTENQDAVLAYLEALDTTAILASPPTTHLRTGENYPVTDTGQKLDP
ncbi:helix-turn-helix domain-containing protein [Streptomyces anulatus]|uniref:helix-turn-helix domain-containing protein n=1 Tax=Streptomyces anulatus TaxID=1892 RepID=UPI003441BA98